MLRYVNSSLVIIFLLNVSSVQAALDAEADKPYQLRIVLDVAPHRLLTPVFQGQLRRELRDGLQAALGKMGEVEVVTSHPLLPDIRAKGLQTVLDGWKDVDGVKTHFVLIDMVDGQYTIQTGQHDGLTGLSSPLVRQARTRDRQFVARTAALLIDRDFGVVGTLAADAQAHAVRVTLKGGELGVPLEHWLAKGEVFALAQIHSAGGKLVSEQVPWALLQLVDGPDSHGVCRCRLFHRYEQPLRQGPGIVGYRCLKLGTTTAPLRLRLIDRQTLLPQSGLQVDVSALGLEPNDEIKQRGSTGPDGVLPILKPDYSYRHVAFVRVSSAGTLIARLPVPILEDHLVVGAVRVDDRAEARGQMEQRRRRLLDRLYDVLLVQSDLAKELNTRLSRPQEQAEALKLAQEGLRTLMTDLQALNSEMIDLRVALHEAPEKVNLDVRENEKLLQTIVERRDQLKQLVAQLEEAIHQEKDPKRQEAKALVAQAQLLEEQADFDQAISLYEKALGPLGNPQQLQEHLAQLRQAWKPRDPAHAEARRFFYDIWAKLDSSPTILAELPRAFAALQTCRQADDKLTPRKVIHTCLAHLKLLNREQEQLQSQGGEDARAKTKVLDEVEKSLSQLHQQAVDWLQGK
ncbi:MAG: hypothetical protein ACK4RK_20085 [Gemmataceae bacterium]